MYGGLDSQFHVCDSVVVQGRSAGRQAGDLASWFNLCQLRRQLDFSYTSSRFREESARKLLPHAARSWKSKGGYPFPASPTPWHEIQRAMVDQLADGMALKPAVRYQRVAQRASRATAIERCENSELHVGNRGR
jgi:hypothetical protein